MSKLTEKINAFTISPEMKAALVRIADREQIQIQQVARKLLNKAIEMDEQPCELSDKVLFEQATVAMEQHYGYGCETEIDAYFRGLKWMQQQLNKQY